MAQVKFIDPKTGDQFTWPNNPPWDAVTQPHGKARKIDRTSNTGNVGAVRQQGDDGPFVIHWEPLVWTYAHELALWEWYVLSSKQSIYLIDFKGDEFEGQITTLTTQEIGALGGPGETAARGYYTKYVFEFEVWRFISGLMADAGVAA